MGDIFDQLAAKKQPKGDIFDQLAASRAPNAGLSDPPAVPVPDELRGIGSIGAPRKPNGLAQSVEQWASDAVGDVQQGQGRTVLGRILQKMGAKGTQVGSQADAGQFMGSPVTGTLNAVRGAGIYAQPGRRLEGVGATASGLAEAGTIPGLIVGGPAVAEAAPVAAGAIGARTARASEAVGSQAAKIFGSTARAGTKFQEVMSKAKDVPIELEKVKAAVDRAVELNARGGGTIPSPMRMFIKRLAKTEELGPITYEEARDFASAAGRLSAKESQATSPQMFSQLAQFSKGMAEANKGAAGTVGQAENLGEAVDLYRRAKKVEKVTDAVKKSVTTGVAHGVGYGIAGAAGGGLAKMLMNK